MHMFGAGRTLTQAVLSMTRDSGTLDQTEAGKLIAKRRRERGLTQPQVVEATGLPSQSYLSALENGRYNVARSEYFPAIARALRLSEDEIRLINPAAVFTMETPVTHTPSAFPTSEGRIAYPIDLAAASYPLESAELVTSEPVFIPRHLDKAGLQLFTASGHSMDDGTEDGIRDGASLFVNTHALDLRDGEVYIVHIEGNGYAVKRAQLHGGEWWMYSDNPAQSKHPPFQVDKARVIGHVYSFQNPPKSPGRKRGN